MARTAPKPVELAPAPETDLERTARELQAAGTARDLARSNLAEARRRLEEADAQHERAAQQARDASVLPADPSSEALLDDAMGALIRADTRRKALTKTLIPAAEAHLAERQAEVASAHANYSRERLREAIWTDVREADATVEAAVAQLGHAVAQADAARLAILRDVDLSNRLQRPGQPAAEVLGLNNYQRFLPFALGMALRLGAQRNSADAPATADGVAARLIEAACR